MWKKFTECTAQVNGTVSETNRKEELRICIDHFTQGDRYLITNPVSNLFHSGSSHLVDELNLLKEELKTLKEQVDAIQEFQNNQTVKSHSLRHF